jgi:hypothetical protein
MSRRVGKEKANEPVSMGDEEAHGYVLAVSRSLLSNGMVEMPQAWYDAQVNQPNGLESRRAVEHSSLVTSPDDVKKAVEGCLYSQSRFK